MAHGETSAGSSSRSAETAAVLGCRGTMGFAMARNISRAGIAVPLLAVVAADAETIALAEGLGVDPALFFPATDKGTLAEGGNTMPRIRRRGLAQAGELPGTLKRSSKEAQETFTKARHNAVRSYGEGDQADRATYAEFKRKFEKRGDHWIPKQTPVPET